MSPPATGYEPPSDQSDQIASRQHWMATLARASADALEAKLAALPDGCIPAYRAIRPPETGMVMAQARAGGTGARFNLGEMTVTRCTVALADGTVGHGYVAGRSHRHAELAALLDGALQTERGEILLQHVVDPLAAEQATARAQQARQAGATKVEFFTMVRGED